MQGGSQFFRHVSLTSEPFAINLINSYSSHAGVCSRILFSV